MSFDSMSYDEYAARVKYFMVHGDSFGFSHHFVCETSGIPIVERKVYEERFKKENM